MKDYEEYTNWLIAKGVNKNRQIHYTHAIDKIFVSGISEEDILHGDIVGVIEEYLKITGNHFTKSTRCQYRHIIRKYREFRGIPEIRQIIDTSAESVTKPISDVVVPELKVSSIGTGAMSGGDSDEKNSFLSWFNTRNVENGRACFYYNIICRIRNSGISELDMVKGDERDICDRYCKISGAELSQKTIKLWYRKAIRLFQSYKQAVAE